MIYLLTSYEIYTLCDNVLWNVRWLYEYDYLSRPNFENLLESKLLDDFVESGKILVSFFCFRFIKIQSGR